MNTHVPWHGRTQSESAAPRLAEQPHERGRPLHFILPVAYGITLFAISLVTIIGIQRGIPVSHFFQDQARVTGAPPYVGLMSNVGALLWCITAAICFFTSILLTKLGDHQWSTFFLFSGVVTAVLLADDFFMVHENVSAIHWRISEELVFGLYGVMLLCYLARFRAKILKTDFLPLLLAFALLAASLLFDQLDVSQGEEAYLVFLEDGVKLLAIVSWVIYFTRTCMQQAQRVVSALNL